MDFASIDWGGLTSTVGFPILMSGLLFWVLREVIKRDKDEAIEREKKLLENMAATVSTLNKVGESIERSDEINRELSETNRLLVEKLEDKLVGIDSNVNKILDKLN